MQQKSGVLTGLKRLINFDSFFDTSTLIHPNYHEENETYKSVLRQLSFYSSAEKRILTLINTLEAKDPYTRGHSESVAFYSGLIADRLGLSESEINEIQIAAYLHDIGKIMIDRRILSKPAKLNHSECSVIKKHPEIGARILKQLDISENIIKAVLHHHERWDGKGYPDRLFAYEIPLYSRILAVADAFDAITSDRPYRSKKEKRQALEELDRHRGTQFEDELVSIIIRIAENTEWRPRRDSNPRRRA